jgi:hypothetical protein
MLQIGASTDAVREARSAIMQIVHAPCGDRVKIAALKAFAKVCDVRNVVVRDCNFFASPPTEGAEYVANSDDHGDVG